MVAPEHEEVLGVFYFVGQHQADRLDRLLSSVDVISQEEVVRVSWKTCVFEQFDQIRVLAVDVS